MLSAIHFNLDQSKILLSGNGLTPFCQNKDKQVNNDIRHCKFTKTYPVTFCFGELKTANLTLTQMTNFRLFQTEKVFRQ